MTARIRILHPFLVAASPVLFLWQHNRGQLVPVTEVLAFLAVALGGTGLVWLVAHALVKDRERSALLASVIALVALTYGHYAMAVTDALRRHGIARVSEDGVLLLVPVLLLAGAAAFGVLRARSSVRAVTVGANAVSAGIVLVSLVGLVLTPAAVLLTVDDVPSSRLTAREAARLPNIYYVVPDEYGHPDQMRDVHGVANDAFVDALTARGFIVPEDTRANYPMTSLSLASTLNMRYVDDLPARLGEDAVDLRPAYALIRENAVMQTLKAHGYDVLHFDSGWTGTERTPLADDTVECGWLSEFQRTAMKTTLLGLLSDQLVDDDLRARVRCEFDALVDAPERVAARDAPTFVFAHVQSPHGPFVLDADGNDVPGSRLLAEAEDPAAVRAELYFDQVRYVNARLLEFVDAVTAHDPDAVVIIQSDHGMNLLTGWEEHDPAFVKDRIRNFNAFRFPGAEDAVPEPFTNVNTFRILLDRYMRVGLEPLPDRTFFSDPFRPYAFRDVTNETAFAS